MGEIGRHCSACPNNRRRFQFREVAVIAHERGSARLDRASLHAFKPRLEPPDDQVQARLVRGCRTAGFRLASRRTVRQQSAHPRRSRCCIAFSKAAVHSGRPNAGSRSERYLAANPDEILSQGVIPDRRRFVDFLACDTDEAAWGHVVVDACRQQTDLISAVAVEEAHSLPPPKLFRQ
jgi:hypothetical protein